MSFSMLIFVKIIFVCTSADLATQNVKVHFWGESPHPERNKM